MPARRRAPAGAAESPGGLLVRAQAPRTPTSDEMGAKHGESMPFRVLKHGRLTQGIIAHLTELIITGRLRPGDYLPREEDLCAQLGASRTAVREAVRVLEARRLVAPKPRVGTVVLGAFGDHLVDALDLSIRGERVPPSDLLEFRRLVEGHAAYLAASRATPHEVAAMRDAVGRMRLARDAGRTPQRAGRRLERGTGPIRETEARAAADPVAADVDFHVALAEASHNALVALVVRALRHALQRSVELTLPVQDRLEMRVLYHGRIVEAIEARDAAAAHQAVVAHLSDTERLIDAQRGGEG